jgi:hypothetical protein
MPADRQVGDARCMSLLGQAPGEVTLALHGSNSFCTVMADEGLYLVRCQIGETSCKHVWESVLFQNWLPWCGDPSQTPWESFTHFQSLPHNSYHIIMGGEWPDKCEHPNLLRLCWSL